ncbi:MAG: hypothetical protein KGM24_08345 [Elusimicrobia bacterium]|nr:hypothetical protein [Elusimicrobiota bacterium]
MKGSRLACVLVLTAASALAAAPALPPAPPVSLEPPPGWADAAAGAPGVLIALKGPVGSSFLVARMPEAALDTAASTRAYLSNVLIGLRESTRLDYRTTGRLETRTFRNGVTAHILRASLDGRPRLIVAALEAGGPPALATLSSAVPDAMLEPLVGSLRMGTPGAIRENGIARSLDRQLQIALGGGLRSRELTGAEIQQNVVLAVQGSGSEVVFLKIGEDDVAPQEQPEVVRATVAGALKIPEESVSPVRRAETPAGPAALYAWARVPGSPDLRFAAGFLPWAYWGYSVLARGPQAEQLLSGVLAAIQPGPASVPRLLAATPVLTAPADAAARRDRLIAGVAAGGLLLLAVFALSRRRKSANLPE